MLRIIATGNLRTLIEAAGWNADRIKRVLKHGLINHVYRSPPVLDGNGNVVTPAGPAMPTWDVLVDRDANDLPAAAVTFLRNRAEVVYVAEWDMAGEYTVLKGADPGYHKFAGWPV